ncbi:MAG TPA: TlpA disulfide reductase family protein [Candidatus Eremiobacteraceae bacterium]|nr:TlpA disulfide reductase family protein [Candidatus Eremiobacteraceae bacterium]
MIRWIVGAVVAVALVVLIAAYFPSEIDQSRGPAQVVGMIAPALTVPLVTGGEMDLNSLRGHDVLLNVWATWCGPCRREMPALERLAREQTGRLVVIAVDQGEAPATARDFAKRFGVTFPVAADPEQRLGTQLHLVGMPSSFFIDKKGVIREAIDGEMTYDVMLRKAQQIENM